MIRKFKSDDLETVLQIWEESNMEAHSFVPQEYWEKNIPFVARELPKSEVWVVEEEGCIKGFAGLSDDYIAGIFVARSYRCCGIGKRLLSFLKEKHTRMSLHVYEKNSRAVAFYRCEGFVVKEQAVSPETHEMEYLMDWEAVLQTER